MIQIQETKSGLLLKVKVQPMASKNEVTGEYDGGLKIRIKSPPVDGKANVACVEFLSGLFGVRKQNIELVKGAASPIKLFRISGVSKAGILERLVNPRTYT